MSLRSVSKSECHLRLSGLPRSVDFSGVVGRGGIIQKLEDRLVIGFFLLFLRQIGARVYAMNPCRCGHAYEPGYSCKRGRIDRCTADYQTRISGPLMDRIDLRIEVPAVTAADLILPPPAEGSAEVAARVAAARTVQLARYAAAGC